MNAETAKEMSWKVNQEKHGELIKTVEEAIGKAAGSGDCCVSFDCELDVQAVLIRMLTQDGFNVASSEKTLTARW